MPQPAPLTSLHAIRALSNTQANQALPVEFQATVTYVRTYARELFVEDGDTGLFVDFGPRRICCSPAIASSSSGETRLRFRPIVVAKSVTLEHHGILPPPLPATFDQLIRGDLDCDYVTLNATVRDAETVVNINVRSTLLKLHTDGGGN